MSLSKYVVKLSGEEDMVFLRKCQKITNMSQEGENFLLLVKIMHIFVEINIKQWLQ